MTYEKTPLSASEIRKLKAYYAQRWLDPVNRIEDIFSVRRADGSLTKLKIPEPQKKMIRDGILGKSRELVGTGISYVGVTNKGRQLGFSVILAAEAILIAEDFPNTFVYYVATAADQASDWMMKMEQLLSDSNSWPKELGGGSIINMVNIEKVFTKNINDTYIVGLSANPPAIRGKTGIAVIFDEAAWAIRFTNQARETWKALKYIIRQGGQARIQSTPRTSDTEEFYWGMYKKGESGNLAVHSYYCPVITNHEELDLEEPLFIELDNNRRQLKGMSQLKPEDVDKLYERYKAIPSFEIVPGKHIKQKAVVPYWWVSIEDLETDRAEDLEQFKQENLGIPLDETYKLLKSEWIYSNLNEGGELTDRGQSTNDFYMLIDLAQVHDITAITLVEAFKTKDGDIVYIERRVEETQEPYPVQEKLIFSLFLSFRPKLISIDFTGHGRPIAEHIEEKLRKNSFNPKIVKRVIFTSSSKEDMATGFRSIVMPDPISGKSRYKWLYKERKHENAIRHCMRVEKKMTEHTIQYTGKMHGRDDHFWSKAQIALIDKPLGVPKAGFGRFKKQSMVGDAFKKKSYGQQFLDELNRKRMDTNPEEVETIEEVNKTKYERVRHLKNLVFATKCLQNGIVICRTKRRPVKPLHCAHSDNCANPHCPGFKYVEEISKRYGVGKNEIWERQKVYK